MEIKLEMFEPMLEVQRDVNKKVNEKLTKAPNAGQYVLAYNVEMYEFINAVGVWKWWKHSHVVDRARILDELADCFAFYLSAALTLIEEIKRDDEVSHPRADFINQSLAVYGDILNGIAEKPADMAQTDYHYGAATELIQLIGTSAESQKEPINTATSFGILLNIAELVLENLTWDEIATAYYAKSDINKKRQEKNY